MTTFSNTVVIKIHGAEGLNAPKVKEYLDNIYKGYEVTVHDSDVLAAYDSMLTEARDATDIARKTCRDKIARIQDAINRISDLHDDDVLDPLGDVFASGILEDPRWEDFSYRAVFAVHVDVTGRRRKSVDKSEIEETIENSDLDDLQSSYFTIDGCEDVDVSVECDIQSVYEN